MKKLIVLFIAGIALFIGCKKSTENIETTNASQTSIFRLDMKAKQISARQAYVDVTKKTKAGKSKFKKAQKNKVKVNVMAPEDQPGDGNQGIYFLTGAYVGDPSDEVVAADGPIVYAASEEDEANARLALLNQMFAAKNLLTSYGLDFSDEFTEEDPRYILAANIMVEAINAEGDPSGWVTTDAAALSMSIGVNRQNTMAGCFLQALGVKGLIDAFANKYATKKMILMMVGKAAARYLGWVGTAMAVLDFADCMWGD